MNRPRTRVNFAAASFLLAVASLSMLSGCGPTPADVSPTDRFVKGAVVQEQDGLTVRVRAVTDDESRDYFGGALAPLGVQAVWIQVQNDGDTGVRYLPILTDPNYFAPQEVAQQLHGWFSAASNARVDALFEQSRMRTYVPPHSVASGFVYTHPDGGLKLINVGLLAAQRSWSFRFAVPIPGREYAVQRVDFRGLYPPDKIEDLDIEQLRGRLQALPCCVSDREARKEGDPLNLVIVGDGIDALFPLAARGWRLNEPVDASSSLRMVKAFLLRSEYDTAPVSPLYLFGRYQDLALQKARSSVSRRNHLRLWLAPFTVEHHNVWIGQISRDVGTKLTTTSWYLTTHRISPYVDQDRDYVLQDLLLTGFVARIGFVSGVGRSAPPHVRHNLADDPYLTDGLRLVVFLGDEPRSPLSVQVLPWERPGTADP
jgi:LssY C-terminus